MIGTLVVIALSCIVAAALTYFITHHEDEPEDAPFPWGNQEEWEHEKEASREWAMIVRNELEVHGLHEMPAKIEFFPSAIEGSPSTYVYVFLSDDGIEGPYFLISEDELEPSGKIVCGYYEGDDQRRIDTVKDRTEMLDWIDSELRIIENEVSD